MNKSILLLVIVFLFVHTVFSAESEKDGFSVKLGEKNFEDIINITDKTVDTSNRDVKTEDSKSARVSVIYNDIRAKSEMSLNYNTILVLFPLKVIIPVNSFGNVDDDVKLDFNFPIPFGNIGYLLDTNSDNYDTFYVDFLFLKYGRNTGGKFGGTSYYGKWDAGKAKPEKDFFEFSGDFSFSSDKMPVELIYAYRNGSNVIGLKYKNDKDIEFSLDYIGKSRYRDLIETIENDDFKYSFGVSYKY
ncbi:MAG: hypothetical protein WC002_10245 [Candidatus Muiribacteriota bacterium]